MRAPTRILHHGPNPISVSEFRDAVVALCRPQFPPVGHARPRPVVLAVSGGVDSMAMACLFSGLLKTHRGIKIADNPAESAFGVVVDHRLRQGSTQEAARVAQELERLGFEAAIKPLNWRHVEGSGMDPSQPSNFEGLARTMRYRVLGSTCRQLQASSLFFAHHRDDQYETVLMRLLAGHDYRGLQGIRGVNAIPECYEMHGVYKSGLVDHQLQPHPSFNFEPLRERTKRRRMMLEDGSGDKPWGYSTTRQGINGTPARPPGHIARDAVPRGPYLAPLRCEDGGVMIYRPLLDFDKDRLIATCEANKVRWWEDHTNADPTLTTRNAVRHVTMSCRLPKALQKPAILALSKRAKRRASHQEAEAHRLLVREAVIRNFDPNVGTLLVELPSFRTGRYKSRRLFANARDEARKPHRRLIAAMAIRKLVEFVMPDLHSPPLASLENVVDRLFPELSSRPEEAQTPKAFTIAGTIFGPVRGPKRTQWFLSRAPYPSSQPLPERKLPSPVDHGAESGRDGSEQPAWRSWKTAELWDGRFWMRVSTCGPSSLHVLPLLPQCAKSFRLALPQKQRARLQQMLKHYAPGKVRYSLPALYRVEGGDAAPTLLALPSLAVHVPGLERWVKYEARYKKIDVTLLGRSRRSSENHGGSRSPSRRRRSRRAAHRKARRRHANDL